MDPVTVGAVLAAIAGGAGGALGSQLWAGLGALVRRPFRRARVTGGSTDAVPSGSAELSALQQCPADTALALTLAQVLVARADADSEFRKDLQAWWELASQVHTSADVTNTVSGGSFHGPVLQGRDFIGLTFDTPARPPSASPAPDAGT
jgi:hypothetical protein